MSLIQRNAVPLFILLAVIVVGVGVLLSRSPFAFGEEPVGCDTSTVGISINITNESGSSVAVVSHGDNIGYTVNLSIPELPEGETACNYGSGILTVTLPGGEQVAVAGTDDTEIIPTVQVGSIYTAPRVAYTVNQNDGVQNASGNVELSARVDYSGGTTFSAVEGEEAAASQSKLVRMTPPSIVIEVTPAGNPGADTQTVYQGQKALFEITVTNTGGFELSDITVTDALAPDCDRAAGTLDTLPVGTSTAPYVCGVTPDTFLTNEAIVTAKATAKDSSGAPVEIEATNSDTSEVVFGEVAVGITIDPPVQVIRTGTEATFDITVTTPSVTALDDVTVTVVRVDGDDGSFDLSECSSAFGTVAADAEVSPYSCSAILPLGRSMVTATVVGTLPGTTEPLPAATASADVQVIAPGLAIVATSGADTVRGLPTVRKGQAAALAISVYNNGDSTLSDVSVVNSVGYPEAQNCDLSLINLGQFDAGESLTINCSTGNLDAITDFVFNVTANARDGSEERAKSDPVTIGILDPSTAVGLSEHNTVVLRLVVQTLTVTETNDGDSLLRDVKVELQSNGVVPLSREPLTRDSMEYVGGDLNGDAILDPGETWEWRVITVSVAGDVVLLSGDALNLELTAIGYGVDELDGVVTHPGDVEELSTIEVPIVTQ